MPVLPETILKRFARQALKTTLLANNSGNAEVTNRALYFDVTGRLAKTGHVPGRRLSPQDSADLQAVALSGTTMWELACQTLRQHYPHSACDGTAPAPVVIRKAAPNAVKESVTVGAAYPNPAQTAVTVPYFLPATTEKAELQLTEVVTGRTVRKVALTEKGNANIQLHLESLPAGMYLYRILTDGQPSEAKKLVIIR